MGESQNPHALMNHPANASIVGSDRVVSNIKGNDYRLVVAIYYRLQIVFINLVVFRMRARPSPKP